MNKKFAILCLSSGSDYVQASYSDMVKMKSYIDDAVWSDLLSPYYDGFVNSLNPTTLTFKTKESADWFMRRRLVYNARRTNPSKIAAMQALFDRNDINPLTSKIEYIIQEIPD